MSNVSTIVRCLDLESTKLTYHRMVFEMSEVLSTSHSGSFRSHRNHSMSGKDHLEIRKFDRTNFALWKNQMRDVLIQRRQLIPLSEEAKRSEGMTKDDWEELDLLAISTI